MSEEQIEFKKALKKMADCLSRRPHSEKELKLKLSKIFSLNVIEQALEKAKQNNWLETEEELSEKIADDLHKKNKSWSYIEGCLHKKGLPIPPYKREKELTKAKNLLIKKQAVLTNLSNEEKMRLKQFLTYRGFERGVVVALLG